jgi:hypothetical protein
LNTLSSLAAVLVVKETARDMKLAVVVLVVIEQML